MNKSFTLGLALIALTACCLSYVDLVYPVDAAEEAGNTWESKTPIPEIISNTKAVAVGDKIYVFGRDISYNFHTYMFDPATNTWTKKTAMPTPREDYAIAALGNKVYVIGGQANSPSDVNEVYDAATDTWETKKPLSQPRRWMDGNVVDGKIYVIGGAAMDGSNLNEVYDPAKDLWTNKAPMPNGWGSLKNSVSIDQNIYFFISSGFTEIYNARNDTWHSGSSIPHVFTGSGIGATVGVHAPKRIYVMGGFIIHGFADVEAVNQNCVYDPVSDSWSNATDLPTARGGLSVAVLNDKLYAIGGGLTSNILPGNPTDAVEVYTPLGYGSISSPSMAPTVSPSTMPLPIPSASSPPSITEQPTLEPSPTPDYVQIGDFTPAIILISTTAIAIAVGAIVYFKKHNRS
jgi:N-acetylneuraminic acid mutarotase